MIPKKLTIQGTNLATSGYQFVGIEESANSFSFGTIRKARNWIINQETGQRRSILIQIQPSEKAAQKLVPNLAQEENVPFN